MNKKEIQDCLLNYPDLCDEDQARVFAFILDDLIAKNEPCEIYFTEFNLEIFFSGYISTGSRNAVAIEEIFCQRIIDWQEALKRHEDINFKSRMILLISRFLIAKGFDAQAKQLCSQFLEQEKNLKAQLSQVDKMTYGYLVFLAESPLQKEEATDRLRVMQADLFIGRSQEEARKKLTPHFLENPYEPAFLDYPSELHPLMAKLFFNQRDKCP